MSSKLQCKSSHVNGCYVLQDRTRRRDIELDVSMQSLFRITLHIFSKCKKANATEKEKAFTTLIRSVKKKANCHIYQCLLKWKRVNYDEKLLGRYKMQDKQTTTYTHTHTHCLCLMFFCQMMYVCATLLFEGAPEGDASSRWFDLQCMQNGPSDVVSYHPLDAAQRGSSPAVDRDRVALFLAVCPMCPVQVEGCPRGACFTTAICGRPSGSS